MEVTSKPRLQESRPRLVHVQPPVLHQPALVQHPKEGNARQWTLTQLFACHANDHKTAAVKKHIKLDSIPSRLRRTSRRFMHFKPVHV